MKKRLGLFKEFFKSEKAGGFILIGCTILSIALANSAWSDTYLHFWHRYIDLSFGPINLKYSVEHWVNDGLMAVFFLLVGLEIERELYVGELASWRNALLPILAAIGGMVVPALIYFTFTKGTPAQPGFGIPMATDIAFALGILSLAGRRVPVSLKIFLTALAIIDDLGAITVIALFYTKSFAATFFFAALGIFGLLYIAGKRKVYNLPFYLIGGIIMWYCMLKSGVHATIAGVLLAFAIPFGKGDRNPSDQLQHTLHYPVALGILPLFALANTAILFPANLTQGLTTPLAFGIIAGLIVGKAAGILGISYLAVKAGMVSMPRATSWRHMAGVSLLAGIGFTMSIFIANLAFTDAALITMSKISILIASVIAAIIGLILLLRNRPTPMASITEEKLSI